MACMHAFIWGWSWLYSTGIIQREREGLGCMSNFNLENFDMIYSFIYYESK